MRVRPKQKQEKHMTNRIHKDPRTENIDYSAYAADKKDPDNYYGLPKIIRFCKKCGVSNQRPNSTIEHQHTKQSVKKTIAFDEAGVCDACRVAEQKAVGVIDWGLRKKELMEVCDRYRSKDGSYDCLVPGSGGKDSFYQSWMLKYEFGMNPLTVTWAPHIYTEWGWRNFNSWVHSGFDNYLVTPNGRIKRLITRLAVENLFHPFQPFIFGQKSLAPKIAAQMGIPLIFYGENEAEYGNPISDNNSSKRDYEYFSTSNEDGIFLGGASIAELKENYGVNDADLAIYKPADPEILRKAGIEVHYLGYYLKWHPQSAYYFAVEKGGFEASPERTAGTYSKYNSIDDKIDDLHYYTTYIKFGIGRATYDASQEVRSGDLELEEAIALIRRYDGEFPMRFASELMDYLSLPPAIFPKAAQNFECPIMDLEYFYALSNRFRSPHLWKFNECEGGWRLRSTLFDSMSVEK
jgi:N-acetyl sugar amidotransferase